MIIILLFTPVILSYLAFIFLDHDRNLTVTGQGGMTSN